MVHGAPYRRTATLKDSMLSRNWKAEVSAEHEHEHELASLVMMMTDHALVVIPESGLAQEDIPMTPMFMAMWLAGTQKTETTI